MADKSAIEWTDATWNPIVGCSIVSPGCTHCYAMGMAGRIEAMTAALRKEGKAGAPHYDGTTKKVNGNTVWTGKLALAPEAILLEPLAWKRPRRIFVNSMGDLFHEDVPDEWIDRVFAVMALAPQHIFQVLTKRAKRMREYFDRRRRSASSWARGGGEDRDAALERIVIQTIIVARLAKLLISPLVGEMAGRPEGGAVPPTFPQWPLPNVWLGVSAERQQEADERIPELLATPAAIRFVSAEPLLGPIDFRFGVHHHPDNVPSRELEAMVRTARKHLADQAGTGIIDWIIAGGESGPNARPMHPAWPRSIRDQCAAAGVPFFFKQWGAWGPDDGPPAAGRDRVMDGTAECAVWSGAQWTFHKNGYDPDCGAGEGEWVYRIGKKAAGRLLDGVEHNAFPPTRD